MNSSSVIKAPIAGCMRWGKWGAGFSTKEYRQLIDACLENGIRSFDHADIYGDYTTEAEFGEALKEMPSLRSELRIISKCGIQMVTPNRSAHEIKSYNTSAAHIISSVDQSLRNFGTDHLDLLLIHRPDPLLHPVEVASAIDRLKQQGKVLQFGVSNFLPHQVDMLMNYTSVEYNQTEISILQLAAFLNGTLENCIKHKIIPMAWAPLGGGAFDDDTHPRFRSIMGTATLLASKYECGVNEILITWLHTHPSGILPVIGTTKIERLIQAKNAASIQMEREDWFKLWIASTGEDVA
ncbi:aldo/keto reductase [Sediminibacterium sp.]|jgi:predicted oxidoreductase|uniref:aldo/keto reductase n=1 Tax=Sediminibacterium sp. TaxID=1917865 RepID=UPI003F6FDB50